MNAGYRVLIVDDNKIARMLLTGLLEQIPGIANVAECENAMEAALWLGKDKTDILFLDVEMPGMSGLELLKSLSEKPLTILTSGNKGYGAEAFELNVVDYLVKPLTLPRTVMAVNRVTELLRQKDVVVNEVEHEHIFIKENKLMRKLQMDDIYLLESKGDYVKIYLTEKYHIVHSTMKTFEDRLPASRFMRVHRSYIVALDKIDYIEENVLYINNIPVPVSESYKTAFLRKINLL